MSEHLKVLILHEGLDDSTIERVKNAFVWAVGPKEEWTSATHGLNLCEDEEELPNFFEHLEFEDLSVKTKSFLISNHQDQYGYVMTLGKRATDKLLSMHIKQFIQSSHLFPFDRWSECLAEIKISLLEFAVSWLEFSTERNRARQQEITHEVLDDPKIPVSKAEWIGANLDVFRKYLEIELENRRPQACIFSMEKGGAFEIVDATLRRRVPLDQTVPVLVSEEIFASKENAAVVIEQVSGMGFENPYLITLDHFFILIRIYCALMKDHAATVMIRCDSAVEEANGDDI